MTGEYRPSGVNVISASVLGLKSSLAHVGLKGRQPSS